MEKRPFSIGLNHQTGSKVSGGPGRRGVSFDIAT